MNRKRLAVLFLAGILLSWGCGPVLVMSRLEQGSCNGPEAQAQELDVYGALLADINEKRPVEVKTLTVQPDQALLSKLERSDDGAPGKLGFREEASLALLDYKQKNEQPACLRRAPGRKLVVERGSGTLVVALSRVGFDREQRHAVVSFEATVVGQERSLSRGLVALVMTDEGWLIFGRLLLVA